jgi:hypothetical protein
MGDKYGKNNNKDTEKGSKLKKTGSGKLENFLKSNSLSTSGISTEKNLSPTTKNVGQQNEELKNWLKEFLNERMDNLENRLLGILDQLKGRIVHLEDNKEKTDKELKVLQAQNASLQEEAKAAKVKLSQVEKSVEVLENQMKRKNIVIHGLKATKDVDKSVEATKFLSNKLGLNIKVKNGHRLGKAINAPLKITISDENERKSVFQNCYKLKGTQIKITPDYSSQTRQKRQLLNTKRLELIANNEGGDIPKLRGDKLFSGEIVYAVEDDKVVEMSTANPPHARTSKHKSSPRERDH